MHVQCVGENRAADLYLHHIQILRRRVQLLETLPVVRPRPNSLIHMEMPAHATVQRVAMTLDIEPEMAKEYIAKHSAPRQSVVDALRSVGLRNLSLWVWRERLFYYAEFVPIGNETFEQAMARYVNLPGVKEWEEVRPFKFS